MEERGGWNWGVVCDGLRWEVGVWACGNYIMSG